MMFRSAYPHVGHGMANKCKDRNPQAQRALAIAHGHRSRFFKSADQLV
jgi:hypothetical protein